MTAAENDRHDRFLRLYVEHEESLRGFVRSLVPTLEDAREVMQQTAAVLWRKFDDSADFRPWAFGVAKIEALAFLRDRARDRHVFGDEVLALQEAGAMEAAQSSEQEERALEECLQKLPAAQRELVETAYGPNDPSRAAMRGLSSRGTDALTKTMNLSTAPPVATRQICLQRNPTTVTASIRTPLMKRRSPPE